VDAHPDEDRELPHIGLVGDTYTILLKGEDTVGRYCLIDMHIPQGDSPLLPVPLITSITSAAALRIVKLQKSSRPALWRLLQVTEVIEVTGYRLTTANR
jgi:hypothetical protein